MTPDALLDLHTYRLLRRVHTHVRRSLGATFAAHGLTGSQYWTLARLAAGDLPLTTLAAMAGADPANISGIVDRLERDGLVARRPDPNDRRINRVCLSEAGRAKLQAVTPEYEAAIAAEMAPLSYEETAALRRLLARLVSEEESQAAYAEAEQLHTLTRGSPAAQADEVRK